MKKFSIRILVAGCLLLVTSFTNAQPLNKKEKFTRQDTLRGSIGKGRDWWDVMSYYIDVTPDYKTKTIIGNVWIHFRAKLGTNKIMQIDLQEPLSIDSIIPISNGIKIKKYWREGNAYFIDFGNTAFKTFAVPGSSSLKAYSIKISYHGKPREAINPPWDGGWIWLKDKNKNPWMSAACQGLGASVWYPCKDHPSDEPDLGALIDVKVPNDLVVVSNGRMVGKRKQGNGTTWSWRVVNPINNYNIVPYIGHYTHWSDNFKGEAGALSIDYWVLDYNVQKAKAQFNRDVKPMLRTFEHWFGPYPFYKDGYKLVETPHLGMEHQSGIAYGNHFQNGYLGIDLSGTGWGKKWDYIVIHESGHEWFANNISVNDIADLWVHEGFTMYSEIIFTERFWGKKAGDEYIQGIGKKIENDKPLIGFYGVNQEGSVDIYYKGAYLVHMIRQVIDNDTLFRNILRGMNKEYYHRNVDSKEIEAYISSKSGKDFSAIFNQYLRTTQVPTLEYSIAPGRNNEYRLKYRWTNVVKGFSMPVRINNGEKAIWLRPTADFQEMTVKGAAPSRLDIDKNFYITSRKLEQ